MSRRAMSILIALTGTAICTDPLQAQSPDAAPLLLTNGNIITLDDGNRMAESLLIHRGRIVAVDDESHELAVEAETIDLGGRTVVPGLIDSHMHFLRATLRPGHDMRSVEAATSIEALLEAIRERSAAVPRGEWVTAIGGWDPVQFRGENRFPSKAELNRASPEHPFLMFLRANGPAVTNDMGITRLLEAGINVGDDGMIGQGRPAIAAFDFLKSLQTAADRVRGAVEYMRHANSLGLTTIRDVAGTERPGAQLFDPDTDYDTVLKLWRDDKLTIRTRLMFMSWDENIGDGSGDTAFEQRLRNAFPGFGDDMLRVVGVGEHLVSSPGNPEFANAVLLAAQGGWPVEIHSSAPADNAMHIDAFEAAHAVSPITDLRWSMTHVQQITPDIATRLKALGGGVTVQVHRYLNRGSIDNNQGGPPLRMLVDLGVPVGGGTDSTNAQPMNPWISIYYMVSGRNVGGYAVNEGQELSRLEALRTYTLGSAFFSHDDHALGSLEVGKYADLAVLSDDYLTVEEDAIRELRSVMTVLGGEVVYADPTAALVDAIPVDLQ
ncbi:MAG: amidohydrolase family protein [Pseudomonadota bacterium]